MSITKYPFQVLEDLEGVGWTRAFMWPESQANLQKKIIPGTRLPGFPFSQ